MIPEKLDYKNQFFVYLVAAIHYYLAFMIVIPLF
jgi:hypothetical protein